MVAGWKSSNAGITSRITAISFSFCQPLDVGREGLMRPLARFKRSQNNVGGHGRTPEHIVAHRGGDRVQDCAKAGANGRLADATCSNRRLRIGKTERSELHLDRLVENGRWLVLIETLGEWYAIVLIVDPLLTDRVADAQHEAP